MYNILNTYLGQTLKKKFEYYICNKQYDDMDWIYEQEEVYQEGGQ